MRWSLPLLIFALISLASCQKERITENISQLAFSRDTVIFDTVFTQIGTSTRNFKVYNRGKGTLRINNIRLARTDSPFRINVDGMAGESFNDVEILEHDSIFVFVEATIDPNGFDNPLIVSDSILFTVNGSVRNVDLVAWGQDAHYIVADQFAGTLPVKVLEKTEVWTSAKPYVVYGYAVVDSASSLTIMNGTRIHFHSGSGLWVYKGGHIRVMGTKDQPVVFQGDRLEPAYRDVPGQWDRIWINEGSQDNIFNYAVIKNGFIGIQAEALPIWNPDPETGENKLQLRNTIIQNHSGAGLMARNYKIDAENLVVANAGQYATVITGGGEFNFSHCTMVNYFQGIGPRNTPAFYMTNTYEIAPKQFTVKRITNTSFVNCIFYGSEKNEFDFDIDNKVACQFSFSHCLMRREETLSNPELSDIWYNQDPLFKDRYAHDWLLTAASPARDKGIYINSNPADFNGTVRTAGEPTDLGAFEFVP